jgi:hypothetical protein
MDCWPQNVKGKIKGRRDYWSQAKVCGHTCIQENLIKPSIYNMNSSSNFTGDDCTQQNISGIKIAKKNEWYM